MAEVDTSLALKAGVTPDLSAMYQAYLDQNRIQQQDAQKQALNDANVQSLQDTSDLQQEKIEQAKLKTQSAKEQQQLISAIHTGLGVYPYLSSNDIEGANKYLDNKQSVLQQENDNGANNDLTHIPELKELLRTNPPEASNLVAQVLNTGVRLGVIGPPMGKGKIAPEIQVANDLANTKGDTSPEAQAKRDYYASKIYGQGRTLSSDLTHVIPVNNYSNASIAVKVPITGAESSASEGGKIDAQIARAPEVNAQGADAAYQKTSAENQAKAKTQPDVIAAESDAKVQAERKASFPKVELAKNQHDLATNNLLQTIREAYPLVNKLTTSYAGQKLSDIGGTDANNLKQILDTIDANQVLQTFKQVRDESKTGAGVGALRVAELSLFSKMVSSLENSQTPEQLKEHLFKLNNYIQSHQQLLNTAYYKTYGDFIKDKHSNNQQQPQDNGGWSIKRLGQ